MHRSTLISVLSNLVVMIWSLWDTSSCISFVDRFLGRDSRRIPRNKSMNVSWTARCQPAQSSCARVMPLNSVPTLNTAGHFVLRIALTMPTSSVCSRSCFTARAFSMITCLTGLSSTCSKSVPECHQNVKLDHRLVEKYHRELLPTHKRHQQLLLPPTTTTIVPAMTMSVEKRTEVERISTVLPQRHNWPAIPPREVDHEGKVVAVQRRNQQQALRTIDPNKFNPIMIIRNKVEKKQLDIAQDRRGSKTNIITKINENHV
mmetsp:Transcript_3719/g.6227  ORF Transcript_3719/g.6227 Transcript_3719/m.6227 type:complete len:260 (+) Transcript_3719:730-1509(+)